MLVFKKLARNNLSRAAALGWAELIQKEEGWQSAQHRLLGWSPTITKPCAKGVLVHPSTALE